MWAERGIYEFVSMQRRPWFWRRVTSASSKIPLAFCSSSFREKYLVYYYYYYSILLYLFLFFFLQIFSHSGVPSVKPSIFEYKCNCPSRGLHAVGIGYLLRSVICRQIIFFSLLHIVWRCCNIDTACCYSVSGIRIRYLLQ